MELSKNILFKPISFKRIVKVVAIIIVAITVIMFWVEWITYFTEEDFFEEMMLTDESTSTEEACNVGGLALRGSLVTYIAESDTDEEVNAVSDQTSSEGIVAVLDNLDKDPAYKAVLLEVDSYGGTPVAAEEVADALKKFSKPAIAWVREGGVSAAYWAATGADFIIASQNSDVGSIGVTYSYLDSSKKNAQEGLTYNQLSSGKFKDTGDMDKPLTTEERKLFERDIAILHDNFIKAVAENRKLPIETVRLLADGSTLLGAMALEHKLIDKIGGFEDAKNWLKEKIGADPVICW